MLNTFVPLAVATDKGSSDVMAETREFVLGVSSTPTQDLLPHAAKLPRGQKSDCLHRLLQKAALQTHRDSPSWSQTHSDNPSWSQTHRGSPSWSQYAACKTNSENLFMEGFKDCTMEVIRFLTEEENVGDDSPLLVGLRSHLQSVSKTIYTDTVADLDRLRSEMDQQRTVHVMDMPQDDDGKLCLHVTSSLPCVVSPVVPRLTSNSLFGTSASCSSLTDTSTINSSFIATSGTSSWLSNTPSSRSHSLSYTSSSMSSSWSDMSVSESDISLTSASDQSLLSSIFEVNSSTDSSSSEGLVPNLIDEDRCDEVFCSLDSKVYSPKSVHNSTLVDNSNSVLVHSATSTHNPTSVHNLTPTHNSMTDSVNPLAIVKTITCCPQITHSGDTSAPTQPSLPEELVSAMTHPNILLHDSSTSSLSNHHPSESNHPAAPLSHQAPCQACCRQTQDFPKPQTTDIHQFSTVLPMSDPQPHTCDPTSIHSLTLQGSVQTQIQLDDPVSRLSLWPPSSHSLNEPPLQFSDLSQQLSSILELKANFLPGIETSSMASGSFADILLAVESCRFHDDPRVRALAERLVHLIHDDDFEDEADDDDDDEEDLSYNQLGDDVNMNGLVDEGEDGAQMMMDVGVHWGSAVDMIEQ